MQNVGLPPKLSLRHAEKMRSFSTCKFADRVCQCALDKLQVITPQFEVILNKSKQQINPNGKSNFYTNQKMSNNFVKFTKIKNLLFLLGKMYQLLLYYMILILIHQSALVQVQERNSQMEINVLFIIQNTSLQKIKDHKQSVVKDMHAEVLAKKALMIYLQHKFLNNLDKKAILYSDSSSNKETLQSFNSIDMKKQQFSTQNEQFPRILWPPANSTLHFYISSSPCGNSIIKKWAKPSLGQEFKDLPESEWPKNKLPDLYVSQDNFQLKTDKQEQIQKQNQVFTFTAKNDGQGCLLLKGSSISEEDQQKMKLKFEMPKATMFWNASIKNNNHLTQMNQQTQQSDPTNTLINQIDSDQNQNNQAQKILQNKQSFTCSDKILFWQHLGFQGSSLSFVFQNPITIQTLTVGRKFSHPHLERAVFARYEPSQKYFKNCYQTKTYFNQEHRYQKSIENQDLFNDQNCEILQKKIKSQIVFDENINRIKPPEPIKIVCMVTKLKFDESVYQNKVHKDQEEQKKNSEGSNYNQDANFCDPKCFWWSNTKNQVGIDEMEILDGRTGYIWNEDSESNISNNQDYNYQQVSLLVKSKEKLLQGENYTLIAELRQMYNEKKQLMFEYFQTLQPDYLKKK